MTKSKKGWGMGQVGLHLLSKCEALTLKLPSKHEALSSSPSTKKKYCKSQLLASSALWMEQVPRTFSPKRQFPCLQRKDMRVFTELEELNKILFLKYLTGST
jgi:hypothetical protein